MRRLRDFLLDVVQTCLRVFPWPIDPGLIRVGNPGRDSPVLLTCNYALTVRRVLRALRGHDAYLLVAPTRGINVWCGAAGGHFTAHQVISILRTSGIGGLVDHRRLILPQLSATGVERKLVEQGTGWHVVFGPVYARDLPAYLASRGKTEAMRQVSFPVFDRLEMAAAWAFPISLVGGTVLALGWRHLLLPFLAVVWALSLALFAVFPWFAGAPGGSRQRRLPWARYLIFFDSRVQWTLLVWLVFVIGLWAYSLAFKSLGIKGSVGWSLAGLFVVLLVSLDLTGSTPLYKSGLHEDRLLHIELSAEACRGRAMCWEVCPKQCYVIDTMRHKATIVKPDACVQCGACVVQCPEDALAFATPAGQRISPEVVRTYKLNLHGVRVRSVRPTRDM